MEIVGISKGTSRAVVLLRSRAFEAAKRQVEVETKWKKSKSDSASRSDTYFW